MCNVKWAVFEIESIVIGFNVLKAIARKKHDFVIKWFH